MNPEDLILKLFTERPLADVTFVVQDYEIRVHKAILGSICPYFYTMLFGSTKEASATRIALNETPLKQFEEVIRFCYLKKVKIGGWSTDEVCKLLSLAHEYNYGLLLDEIVKEMQTLSMMNPISLPELYNFAVALNFSNLLKAIEKYLRRSFAMVENSEEFVKYSADMVSFIVNVGPRSASKSLCKWKACHSDEEVNQVFSKIAWEKLPSKRLGKVIRVFLPLVKLSKLSETTEIRANPGEANQVVVNRGFGDDSGSDDEADHEDEFGVSWRGPR